MSILHFRITLWTKKVKANLSAYRSVSDDGIDIRDISQVVEDDSRVRRSGSVVPSAQRGNEFGKSRLRNHCRQIFNLFARHRSFFQCFPSPWSDRGFRLPARKPLRHFTRRSKGHRWTRVTRLEKISRNPKTIISIICSIYLISRR